jgi:uncharacterized Zn-finger protein
MPDTLSRPAAPPGAPAVTETIHVDETVIACDGGGGPLGHPRVFLHLVEGEATCPYCSRRYVLNEGAGHAPAH